MPKIKSEKHFGNVFIGSPSIGEISTADSFYLAEELKTNLGVPDYVILSESDYDKLKLFAKNHPDINLSGRYAAVVSYVSKNDEVSIDALASLFREKKTQILRSLEKLEQWGVITFHNASKNSISLNVDFALPQISSIAIELKLSSWEKALWQAIRNSSQFVSSYVVMPNKKINLLESKKDLFASNNINTAVFDIDSLKLTHITKDRSQQELHSRYYIESLNNMVSNLPSFKQVKI